MSCLSLGPVVLPTLGPIGVSVGFALPPITLSADLCCKIRLGPWPVIPPIGTGLSVPPPVIAAVNAVMALFQAWLDLILSAVNIECPLD